MTRLNISLLGGFAAAVDGVPVTGFDTDKTRALLAYLAAEPARLHAREALAGLLWPEIPEDAARRNLRNSLFRLRQALGEDEGTRNFLLVTPGAVRIEPTADIQVDLAAFNALIAACSAHRHRHVERCGTCHARLVQAVTLYQGNLLAGLHLGDSAAFEEWLVVTRERLHREAFQAIGRLAAYHRGRAEYLPALEYTFRQLELEPWAEAVHRQAMWLLANTGQRSAALAQYAACRKVLAEELHAEPGGETTALYERLRADELTGDAPAPHRPVAQHNLPHGLTPFIGRKEELVRVLEHLDSPDYSLITLTGPGGVGKTRLALQAASEQVGAFNDGVYWVPLAGINSPNLLTSTIAHALSLPLGPVEDPAEQLITYLRQREVLLVLDNFEHLLSANTGEVSATGTSGGGTDLLLAILRGAPRLCMLVTSQERLGLQAEFLIDVSGLPLPPANIGSSGTAPGNYEPSDLAALMEYEAAQLFVERAQQASGSFVLTPGVARDVADICRLVGGLPLGIVLAAAWVRHFTPARIATSIRENLDFLTSTARDLSPQHGSLRAVFNHSWSLLSAEEKQTFRRLAVFRDGWTEEAAERVVGAKLLTLLSLVDKSLLRQDTAGRFGVHDVLRRYAAEKLGREQEEEGDVQQLHALFYLEMAEAALAGFGGESQAAWLDSLEQEHDNLRAALLWARESRRSEVGLRMAGALSRFWFVRGYLSEGRETLSALLALPFPYQTDQAQAAPGEEVRQLAIRARALQAAGDLCRAQGDYAAARPLCEESLALSRQVGSRRDVAVALVRLAIVAWNLGDSTAARTLYEESLALSRELGDKRDIAIALGGLGNMLFVEGAYAAARPMFREGLEIYRELGDKYNLAIKLNNLGNVALMEGDFPAARLLHLEALGLRRDLGDKWGIAICLIGLGGVLAGLHAPEKGTRLIGAAEMLLDNIGASLEVDDRIPYEWVIEVARSRLGEETFQNALREGRAMSMEQAIQVALGERR